MRLVGVQCKQCGRVNASIGNWQSFWNRMKLNGWVKGDSAGKHYCPECNKKDELSASIERERKLQIDVNYLEAVLGEYIKQHPERFLRLTTLINTEEINHA